MDSNSFLTCSLDLHACQYAQQNVANRGCHCSTLRIMQALVRRSMWCYLPTAAPTILTVASLCCTLMPHVWNVSPRNHSHLDAAVDGAAG